LFEPRNRCPLVAGSCEETSRYPPRTFHPDRAWFVEPSTVLPCVPRRSVDGNNRIRGQEYGHHRLKVDSLSGAHFWELTISRLNLKPGTMPRLRQRGKVGPPEPTTKLSLQSDSPGSAGTTAAGSTALPSHIKKRLPRFVLAANNDPTAMTEAQDEHRALLDDSLPIMVSTSWIARNQWIVLALASGGCAAFNGVFAKL